MIGLVLLSVCVVGVVMLAMGVGAMISGRCLRGSCGALHGTSLPTRDLACDTCPLRHRGKDA